MKKAIVLKTFSGVIDGNVHPVMHNPGDEIAGELAASAVAAGLAEEVGDEPAPEAAPLDKMTRAELEAVAAEMGLDIAGAKTKADIIAAIEAVKVKA